MDSWKMREEINQALSRWYLILAFILVGAIVGFVISYILPSPYRAVAEIYVGIDIERVNHLEYLIPLAEEEPLNLDDYKNWQLKQVADILKSDLVLERTLISLQENNTSWEDTDLEEFRKGIDIYWYDAGTWRLEFNHSDKERAIEAVQVWMTTGHKKISELIQISQTGNAIDQDVWTFNLAISDLKVQRANCERIMKAGDDWLTNLGELSDADQLSSDNYSAFVVWSQDLLSGHKCGVDPSSVIPGQGDSIKDISEWISQNQSLLGISVDRYTEEMNIIKAERDQLLPEFHNYLDDTLGISANVVLMPETSAPEVYKEYSSQSYTLGGGFIGLMAWLIYLAVGISTRKEDHGK